MKYIKTGNLLDEIDWGNGGKFKYNSYWNDDTSFVLDIGDGELIDKDGNSYFIHCEYNCDNGMWHYVFEIWFEMIVATSTTFQNLAEVNIFQKQRSKNCEVLFITYARIK